MTATAPIVSVIIIFLNAERFLAEAIASVRAQTLDAWELILVDDGSTDASREIAEAAAQADPARVRYLHHPGRANLGMSASRNAGVRAARGTYVAFIDSDDVFKPAKLEQQVEVFRRNPDVEFVYGRSLMWFSWAGAEAPQEDFCYDLGVPANCRYAPPRLFRVLIHNRAQTPTPCNAIMTKALIERVGGFDESFRGLFEDQFFFAKALLAAPAWVDDRIWALYRQHPASYMAQLRPGKELDGRRRRFLDAVSAHLAQQARAPLGARLALWRARLDILLRALRRVARAGHFGGEPA